VAASGHGQMANPPAYLTLWLLGALCTLVPCLLLLLLVSWEGEAFSLEAACWLALCGADSRAWWARSFFGAAMRFRLRSCCRSAADPAMTFLSGRDRKRLLELGTFLKHSQPRQAGGPSARRQDRAGSQGGQCLLTGKPGYFLASGDPWFTISGSMPARTPSAEYQGNGLKKKEDAFEDAHSQSAGLESMRTCRSTIRGRAARKRRRTRAST